MWVYDLESYRFLDVNEAAEAQYGYRAPNSAHAAARHPSGPRNLPVWKRICTNNASRSKLPPWRHRKKSGEIILVEISSHTMQWQDRAAVTAGARRHGAPMPSARWRPPERKFRDLAEQLPGLIVILMRRARATSMSGAAMLGRTVRGGAARA